MIKIFYIYFRSLFGIVKYILIYLHCQLFNNTNKIYIMETLELTNKLTKVFFSQYGENKMLEYNGTSSEARQYIKYNLGINSVNTYYTVVRNSYLPKGYASIETV